MSVQSSAVTKRKTKELGFWQKVWRQRQLVVLSLPVLMVIIFSYVPLWGWSFAFFNYKPTTGLNVFANDWIGLQSFQELFTDAYFWRGLKAGHRCAEDCLLLRLFTFAGRHDQ